MKASTLGIVGLSCHRDVNDDADCTMREKHSLCKLQSKKHTRMYTYTHQQP